MSLEHCEKFKIYIHLNIEEQARFDDHKKAHEKAWCKVRDEIQKKYKILKAKEFKDFKRDYGSDIRRSWGEFFKVYGKELEGIELDEYYKIIRECTLWAVEGYSAHKLHYTDHPHQQWFPSFKNGVKLPNNYPRIALGYTNPYSQLEAHRENIEHNHKCAVDEIVNELSNYLKTVAKP